MSFFLATSRIGGVAGKNEAKFIVMKKILL